MNNLIPLQLEFRPEVRAVEGNVDYKNFESTLRRIDDLLHVSGVEKVFVKKSVKRFREQAESNGREAKEGHVINHEKIAVRVLRCNILICLLGEDYRGMSRRLAECPLYRWFCHVETFDDKIKVPGKSTLQDYAQRFSADEMTAIVKPLICAAANGQTALELANDVELDKVWIDSTALKTNIHFPVDWVLLRDTVRTLIKAIILIRKHGLMHRMPKPEKFLREINGLCIEMTHSRRKADSGRKRKKVLRRMKQVVKVVESHAHRYYKLLDEEWEKTDWTRKQAECVLNRIEGIIEQLPTALKQAHERIIGGRKVKSEDKLLSLYEKDTQVIARGKSGAEVEFGNKLILAEQADGLIVDWKLYQDKVPADVRILQNSVERVEDLTKTQLQAVVADRGFDSSANVSFLDSRNIVNGICPKSPSELKTRCEQTQFRQLQHRRARTEARIGIFKNVFCGTPMKIKGFKRREIAIAWRVLTHNLWVLARMPKYEQNNLPLAA